MSYLKFYLPVKFFCKQAKGLEESSFLVGKSYEISQSGMLIKKVL
jgi:hypothetical protein